PKAEHDEEKEQALHGRLVELGGMPRREQGAQQAAEGRVVLGALLQKLDNEEVSVLAVGEGLGAEGIEFLEQARSHVLGSLGQFAQLRQGKLALPSLGGLDHVVELLGEFHGQAALGGASVELAIDEVRQATEKQADGSHGDEVVSMPGPGGS